MTPDPDWPGRFEADARERGDARRLRLAGIVYDVDAVRESRPDQALALIDEARALARDLAEPWWGLFYDDRRAGVLMKYMGDARGGLEQAVRNVLRLRSPAFACFPWRSRVHDHLVVGYLNTDPIGYADEIRAALDHLETELPDGGSPRYLLLARRRWLAAELGRPDEAEAHARAGLALAADDPDRWTAASHAVFCYSHLCHAAWLRGGDGLAALAGEGEALARTTGHRLEHAEFQLWRALLARRDGDQAAARRLAHQARARVARLGMPPDHIYFDALAAFHLEAGEVEHALAARDRELALLVGRDRWHAEARCRAERCRLLDRLGRLTAADVEETRRARARLRRPGRPEGPGGTGP
jgi:hypothetical protein